MEELVYYSSLYDYYGELLSPKEKEYFKEYFFENLSLQEIADNYNVSKNAVSKSIKEAKEKLLNYENILKLLSKKEKIKSILNEKEYSLIEDYL